MKAWLALIARYLAWLETRQYAATTVARRRSQLHRFAAWSLDRGLRHPHDVATADLEAYTQYLRNSTPRAGRVHTARPIHINTVKDHLGTLRGFFRWLDRAGELVINPAQALTLPKSPSRLPRVLSAAEIERILAQPDVTTRRGLRDRAIMETFYATGMRASELSRLTIRDIAAAQERIWIRLGKGKKDRLVPLGARALAWIERYLEEARPHWLAGPDPGTLYLAPEGKPLRSTQLSRLVKRHMQQAGIEQEGACHLFRHSVATLMLDNGADIRHIQELLGHASLEATQRYTHVSLARLREAVTKLPGN